MPQCLSLVTLVVRSYDEALAFYRDRLGFDLVGDKPLAGGKRWVVVAPAGGGTGLLLAQAADDRQVAAVGDQSGGRVFLFLETDDFRRDHARLTERGVSFLEKPREEAYGTVAVFENLYGNRWDLIETRGA